MEEESVPEQQLLAEVKDEFGRKRIFGQQGTLRLIECVRQRPKLWHRQYLRSRASGIEDWEEIQRKANATLKNEVKRYQRGFPNGSITPDLSDQFLCDTSTRNKCQCKLIYCFHKPVHTYETRTRCRCRLMLERLPNELDYITHPKAVLEVELFLE